MNEQLQKHADDFIKTLQDNARIRAFMEASRIMEGDDELSELRATYEKAAAEFMNNQANGTITQQDIEMIRGLQSAIGDHPAWTGYFVAKSAAQELLRGCNQAMSGVLGFDFASTAAPPGAC